VDSFYPDISKIDFLHPKRTFWKKIPTIYKAMKGTADK
jgi:hypothetical protein